MNTESLWKEVHGCQRSLALEGFVCELQSWGRGITRMERAERWWSLFTNLKRGHQCARTSLPSYPLLLFPALGLTLCPSQEAQDAFHEGYSMLLRCSQTHANKL